MSAVIVDVASHRTAAVTGRAPAQLGRGARLEGAAGEWPTHVASTMYATTKPAADAGSFNPIDDGIRLPRGAG